MKNKENEITIKKETPVIEITEPENIEINEYLIVHDYDNSHLFYKGIDLGSFSELMTLYRYKHLLEKLDEFRGTYSPLSNDQMRIRFGHYEDGKNKSQSHQIEMYDYMLGVPMENMYGHGDDIGAATKDFVRNTVEAALKMILIAETASDSEYMENHIVEVDCMGKKISKEK